MTTEQANNNINNHNNYNNQHIQKHYPTASEQQSADPQSVFEVQFPDLPSLACGGNYCEAQHTWPIVGQLVQCPGCTGAVLVVKLSNCPFCNEPSLGVRVTTIFTPSKSIPTVCNLPKEGQNAQSIQQEFMAVEIKRPTEQPAEWAPIPAPVHGPDF